MITCVCGSKDTQNLALSKALLRQGIEHAQLGHFVWCLSHALGTRTLSRFGHGCSGCSVDRMLLEHERYYGLGMDAAVAIRVVVYLGYYGTQYRVRLYPPFGV